MNDQENVALSDEGSGTPAPVETERAPATLDEVYKTHKIEDEAQKYRQDEFKPLAPVVREDGLEILNTLNAVSQEVNNLRQERHVSAIRQDIDSAVSVIEKETGLDKKLIEVHLDLQARDDPRFQRIWNERKSNPRAFNAAIQAVSNEIADKYQSRPDPTLLANQRALRAYQGGSSTRQSASDGWENLSEPNFDRKWSQLTS